jgi:hypothetical protein
MSIRTMKKHMNIKKPTLDVIVRARGKRALLKIEAVSLGNEGTMGSIQVESSTTTQTPTASH